MKHRPTRLALLISLIGVGVAPCAYARSEVHVIGAPEVTLENALDDVAATILERRDPYPDFAWAPERASVALSEMPGALALYGNDTDDWAPGESPAVAVTASVDGAALERAEVPVEPRRKQAGKSHRVRVLLRGPSLKARLAEIFKADDARAIERSAAQVVAGAPALASEPAPASADSFAAVDTPLPSAHAERLLEDLAVIVREEPSAAATTATATAPEQASSRPLPEPVADVTEVVPERRDATTPRPDPKDIVVESESTKVLRSLGAILSDERDEVGAIRPDSHETVVTNQSDKVMAMLAEVAAPHQEPVEDGAAKRARKRAALAAKAAAQLAQHAAVEDASRAARSGEPQAVQQAEPLAAAPIAETPPTLESTVAAVAIDPPDAESAPRASPFGDQRVAISEGSLDRVRGGYGGSDGLNISFGIERAVYINGSLVTTTSLNVSSLGQVVAGRGATTFDAGTIALIQSGMGNTVSTGSISSASMGTVIQNTLDGQKIQNITVINATANSLGLMRGMNLGSSLRGAVIDSLRR